MFSSEFASNLAPRPPPRGAQSVAKTHSSPRKLRFADLRHFSRHPAYGFFVCAHESFVAKKSATAHTTTRHPVSPPIVSLEFHVSGATLAQNFGAKLYHPPAPLFR